MISSVIFMNKIIFEHWVPAVHVSKRAGLSFAPHMHDEVEITYIKKGPVTAYVDDSEYTLKNGCLLITFPNQLHSYVDHKKEDERKNYIMIFKSSVLKNFSADIDSLVPENPIITDKDILAKIEAIFEEACLLNAQDSEYKFQALNAYATLILQKILPSFKFKKIRKLQKDASADIFTYCNKHFCDDISLEKMSKEINISKEHIMRIFRECFHTNFRAYVNRLRIYKAKNLLKNTDYSITEISSEVGFNTIRTFNRVFFSFTGQTPSEYR